MESTLHTLGSPLYAESPIEFSGVLDVTHQDLNL